MSICWNIFFGILLTFFVVKALMLKKILNFFYTFLCLASKVGPSWAPSISAISDLQLIVVVFCDKSVIYTWLQLFSVISLFCMNFNYRLKYLTKHSTHNAFSLILPYILRSWYIIYLSISPLSKTFANFNRYFSLHLRKAFCLLSYPRWP